MLRKASVSDTRPPKRIKDPEALRRYRLSMMNEPCEACELRPGTDAHHVTFRSQGGDDTADNLIWLCRLCHNERHGI